MLEPKPDLEQLHAAVTADLDGIRPHLLELLAALTPPDEEKEKDADPLRAAIWRCVRDGVDPLLGHLRTVRAAERLDLTRDDAATRQLLRDFVVRDYFQPQLLADPGDIFVPAYTPEEAGLEVYLQHGRWFVTWVKLEEPEGSKSRELLILEEDTSRPGALRYREV